MRSDAAFLRPPLYSHISIDIESEKREDHMSDSFFLQNHETTNADIAISCCNLRDLLLWNMNEDHRWTILSWEQSPDFIQILTKGMWSVTRGMTQSEGLKSYFEAKTQDRHAVAFLTTTIKSNISEPTRDWDWEKKKKTPPPSSMIISTHWH